jgi:hypothetical protein
MRIARKKTLLVLASGSVLLTTQAIAQGWTSAPVLVPIPLIDLPSLHRDAQRVRKQTTVKAESPPRPTVTSLALLRFTPNLATRQLNFAQWVDQARAQKGAGAASSLRSMLDSGDLIKASADTIAPLGLRTDNVADAMAFYVISHWMAARGTTDLPTRAQALAVKRQMTAGLMSTNEVAALSPAKKQDIAEQMLIQALLAAGAMQGAEGNPAAMAGVARQATQALRGMGIEAGAMALGPNGFGAVK